jgi:hypothetical protein
MTRGGPVRALALALGFLAIAFSTRARGQGALDRFEGAHQPPPSPAPAPYYPPYPIDPQPNTDPTYSPEYDTAPDYGPPYDSTPGYAPYLLYGGYGLASDGTSAIPPADAASARIPVGLLVFCSWPTITFACVIPPFRVAVEPYRGDGLYLRSTRGEPPPRSRMGDASLSVYRALNEAVLGHQIDINAWTSRVRFHSRWERLYERLERKGTFDALDLFALHVGSNMLGSLVGAMELDVLAGATLMHGEQWTPAFDVGIDLRAYPRRPLALQASIFTSFFQYGPPLLDARLSAGIVGGAVEVRVGARWLYQGQAQGFWGPMAAVGVRF